MFESVINKLANNADPILWLLGGSLIILMTILMWVWQYNRRKYHNLKHAIPADVVKNYLDSIIQNSTSLKSQLFRGGGLDVGSVPSVMPLHQLGGGEGLAVSGAPSTALLEELNQKKAYIASLEAQLSAAQNAKKDVEARLSQTQSSLTQAEARIKELEALLAQSGNTASVDSSSVAELQTLIKERDELRDRLKEFEIIADDLANLKRLQQENEQLKRSLSAQGGTLPKVEAPAASQSADVSDLLEDLGQSDASAETSELEDFLSSPTQEVATEEDSSEADMLAAMSETKPEEDNKSKSGKTPEDLLSEFEKMLG